MSRKTQLAADLQERLNRYYTKRNCAIAAIARIERVSDEIIYNQLQKRLRRTYTASNILELAQKKLKHVRRQTRS